MWGTRFILVETMRAPVVKRPDHRVAAFVWALL
jgi:hypothetical protein